MSLGQNSMARRHAPDFRRHAAPRGPWGAPCPFLIKNSKIFYFLFFTFFLNILDLDGTVYLINNRKDPC